jgi:hypothetical protein
MSVEKVASKRLAQLFTEDWLAVAVGLLLVTLVLAGVLRNVP